MTPPFHGLAELHTLLDAPCEETITPEQGQRLEELVLTYPEAEAYYVQYLSLYADLVSHFSVLPGGPGPFPPDRTQAGPGDGDTARRADKGPRTVWQRFRYSFSPRLFLAVSAVAAALLVAFALWPKPKDVPEPHNLAVAEASDDTVAVLLQATEAVWDDTDLPTRVGAPLRPGWLRLKAGFAQIEFYKGAMVILQGPADFRLVSRTEAFVARGKLRAAIPHQAQGFTIKSPDLEVVDRGTEFGLRVNEGGGTEVQVFQGKVELRTPGAGGKVRPRALTTGQGVRLDGPGVLRPVKVNSADFLTAQELAARAKAEARRRQKNWLEASEALSQDPSLLVYYTFKAEQPWSRTLLDHAQGHKQLHNGVIVGCSWVTGRWPGKQGLEFKQVSDRVRFQVPGSSARSR